MDLVENLRNHETKIHHPHRPHARLGAIQMTLGEWYALKLGDKYMWGKIAAKGIKEGERYVMTMDRWGGVGLWPIYIKESK